MRSTAALMILLLMACNPSDQRPGLWLGGEATPFAEDWSFTDEHKEIAIQIKTPYWLPHSVTIWCATINGELYVAAGAPETKRWPAWADADPDVKLVIDGKLYAGQLQKISDQATRRALQAAYAIKYDLPSPSAGAPTAKYWQVLAAD